MTSRILVVVLFACLVTVAATVQTVDAQGPERRPGVAGRPDTETTRQAGWKVLFHRGCRFAVPMSWRPDADDGSVFGPDGSNLFVRTFRITSWSAHKAQIRTAFGQVKAIHEDSDRRLWLEIGDRERTQHYIDVANGLSACIGLLEIRGAAPDAESTASRIAASIGRATDK